MRNISITELNTLQIEPTITGRILLYVDAGRVVSNISIPSDHIVASVDAFMELAERAGYKKNAYESIAIQEGFTGDILVHAENGKKTHQRELRPNEHVATILGLIEIAEQAGYKITAR
ncbi:hypothetical protein [Hafnia alvei]|uniref:Uncharacterized protein n=1 Tax=Hafnia alvei TaxID=569 RepID=A0A1C6YVS8_HAFAL|nr:hypothetical protein [Hafnia alvei]NLS56234.1 hypothetical protein [Hafnia alvei]SCM50980.1 hypothetical protein BN1044_00430 [Hafnia alvei]